MIDVSIMIRNCASESTASAFQRRGSCVAIIDSCLLLLLPPISCSLAVFVVVMANSSLNGYIATWVYNCKIKCLNQFELAGMTDFEKNVPLRPHLLRKISDKATRNEDFAYQITL